MTDKGAWFAAQITVDQRYLYVSEPPGKGGKDWGYTFDVTKAMRMNSFHVERFRSYAEHCAMRFQIGQW